MQNGTDLYALDINDASFVKACGGDTHPDGESYVAPARIGEDAWALGDSKRPEAQPLDGNDSCTTTAIYGPARKSASTRKHCDGPRIPSRPLPEAGRN